MTENIRSLAVYAVQVSGCLFTAVFLLAYILPFPADRVLHSEPVFRGLLAVLGSLFLALTLIALFLSLKRGKTNVG
jgi:hypothetical protein